MSDSNDKTDLEVFFGEGGFEVEETRWLMEVASRIGWSIEAQRGCCFDDITIAIEGVYCDWCDSAFWSLEHAVEILARDKETLMEAFKGKVMVEDRPHIEFDDDGTVEYMSKEECQKISSMQDYFESNIEAFKEIVEKGRLGSLIEEPNKKAKSLKM